MSRSRCLLVVTTAAALSACFDLDGFVWNGRHCSVVDDVESELCTRDKVCTPCDDDYPWADVGIPPELVTRTPVPLEDGEKNDAYLVASNGARPHITLVYAHGNYAGIEHYLNRVALLWQTGANVFVVDYRGFGKSTDPAEATEDVFMADARVMRAFLDDVLTQQGLAGGAVALVGFSAGALASVEMAVASDNCALVLENPWPNVQRFTDDSTQLGVPHSFVTQGAWDNISKMARVDEPLLHLHAERDETVRVELGRELFAAAHEPKELRVIESAEHGNFGNDVPTVMGDDYASAIVEHLDRFCPAPAPGG